MHASSMEKMEKFVEEYLDASKKLSIADIGSLDVNGSYKPLFNAKKWTYTGVDIVSGKNVNVAVDEHYNWNELKSNSFNVVISGQALEHMGFFWEAVKEIERILKPGGLCCIIAPSIGDYHDEYDSYRFSAAGMRAIAKYAGFDVIEAYTDNVGHWRDSILIAAKPSKVFEQPEQPEQDDTVEVLHED